MFRFQINVCVVHVNISPLIKASEREIFLHVSYKNRQLLFFWLICSTIRYICHVEFLTIMWCLSSLVLIQYFILHLPSCKELLFLFLLLYLLFTISYFEHSFFCIIATPFFNFSLFFSFVSYILLHIICLQRHTHPRSFILINLFLMQ